MPVGGQKDIHNIAPWLGVFQPLLAEKIFKDTNLILHSLHSHLAFLAGGQPYRLYPERSLSPNAAIVLNIWRVVNSVRHSASAALCSHSHCAWLHCADVCRDATVSPCHRLPTSHAR